MFSLQHRGHSRINTARCLVNDVVSSRPTSRRTREIRFFKGDAATSCISISPPTPIAPRAHIPEVSLGHAPRWGRAALGSRPRMCTRWHESAHQSRREMKQTKYMWRNTTALQIVCFEIQTLLFSFWTRSAPQIDRVEATPSTLGELVCYCNRNQHLFLRSQGRKTQWKQLHLKSRLRTNQIQTLMVHVYVSPRGLISSLA